LKLEIGIYHTTPATGNIDGWRVLCEQEKTPYRLTAEPDCPVTLFDGDLPGWFMEYMKSGGVAVITDCRKHSLPFADFIASAAVGEVDLTELNSGIARLNCIGNIFKGEGLGKISLHEQRKMKDGIESDCFPAFLYYAYGKGGCWYTGLPLSRLILSLGDTLRACAEFSDYTERIVAVDKHQLLASMRFVLVDACHKAGLPFCSLGYYPAGYDSVFTFRIDVDGIYGQNMLNISRHAKQNGIRLTFFVNKSLSENEHDLLRQIDPFHMIGNHATIHNLFTDYDENYSNVEECESWMNRLELKNGKWFAAPRGMWNYNLHQALENLGYQFTSDFGFCIDGLPFFPYFMGKRSKTMQIPINPFSVERAFIWMDEQGKTLETEFVTDYFKKAIESQYQKHMPIMFYSHPKKFGLICAPVFDMLRTELAGRNIWNTSLPEFADWWRRRDETRYEVVYDSALGKTEVRGDFGDGIIYREE
jgi:hypothetical protein